MFRRFILTFTLSLLFGIAQLGALMHEISHFSIDTSGDLHTDLSGDLAIASKTVNPVSADQKTPQDHAPDTPFCAKCLSYGALAHSLNTSNFTLALFANNFELHQAEQHNSYLKPLLISYAARAPPKLT